MQHFAVSLFKRSAFTGRVLTYDTLNRVAGEVSSDSVDGTGSSDKPSAFPCLKRVVRYVAMVLFMGDENCTLPYCMHM